MSIEDGINAVRMTLSRCYFDFEKTKEGLDALRQYRWAVNDKGESKNRPQHDWTSHSADANLTIVSALCKDSYHTWEYAFDYFEHIL